MITKIHVQNRFNMDLIAQFGIDSGFPFHKRTWHLISIYTGESAKCSPLYLTEKTIQTLKTIGMKECLSLRFGDITEEMVDVIKAYPNIPLFKKEQAEDVVKFLNDRKAEQTDDILMVHCDAGISRSGAVAIFSCEFFDLDYREFQKDNPYLCPNSTVMRLLRKAAGIEVGSAFQTMLDEDKENRKDLSGKIRFA
jgi:predicted protein tyrosine phosphatase